MPIERFYSSKSLHAGQQVEIEGQEFHHLVHVTRIEKGDTIDLVNGQGVLAKALVDHIDKKKAVASIQKTTLFDPPAVEIILAQAIPRMNRLDFILEKGTELGMTQLWLFPGQRSERKELSHSQQERMQAVTVAAMKQSGRVYLPKIVVKSFLKSWQSPSYRSFFGDLQAEAPRLSQALAQNPISDGIIFYVGPESGFTEEELALLREWNAQGVKLNEYILRTDTAALAALSIMNEG